VTGRGLSWSDNEDVGSTKKIKLSTPDTACGKEILTHDTTVGTLAEFPDEGVAPTSYRPPRPQHRDSTMAAAAASVVAAHPGDTELKVSRKICTVTGVSVGTASVDRDRTDLAAAVACHSQRKLATHLLRLIRTGLLVDLTGILSLSSVNNELLSIR